MAGRPDRAAKRAAVIAAAGLAALLAGCATGAAIPVTVTGPAAAGPTAAA